MQRFALLAAAAILLTPAAASAAASDPLVDLFRSVCVAHAGDYAGTLKAADSSGWADARVSTPAEATITVTSQAARSMALNGTGLTLLVSTGLQHMRTGDQPETTCRIQASRPDASAIDATKAWLGLKPDGGDDLLAYFLVTGGPDNLVHITGTTIPPAGMSLIKVQQDADLAILIDQFYVGKP